MLQSMNIRTYIKLCYHQSYVNNINRSRIFVNSNNRCGASNQKFTEVLACGTCFLSEVPVDSGIYGFIPGYHYAVFDGVQDMKKKILYLLGHPNVREEIAVNGMKFVRENHSNDVRVKEFTDVIREKLL